MPKRKKHPRLPNGYGSIRYLGKSRKNPYAVHPPADIDGNRPPALCYVDDWMKGFIVLTSYKAGTYTRGMEATLLLPDDTNQLDKLTGKLLADYNRVKGIEPDEPEKTFSEVYEAFYADKFFEGNNTPPQPNIQSRPRTKTVHPSMIKYLTPYAQKTCRITCIKDNYLGTPAVINASGISKVIEVPLNERESEAMTKSAEALKKIATDGMTKVGLVNYLIK